VTTAPPRLQVTPGELLLGSGPRFARDAAGPGVAFYVGWKLAGLGAGVAAAMGVALASYAWERRQGRGGLAAGIGLGIALVQAVVGLASGSAIAFFAPGVLANGLYGVIFVASVALGRPLAGLFAREMYPLPAEVAASAAFRRTFMRISLVWSVMLLARAAFRLVVLSWRDVDVFVLLNVVTGPPLTFGLLAWSVWYGRRRLLRAFAAQRL
jgi:hypothetical protein